MAVGTSPPSVESTHPRSGRGSAKIVDYDEYIDEQIRKTRSFVKSVEIAFGVLSLVVAVLGFILAAVILDHWLVPGGLGFWGRLACFAVLTGGTVYLFARWVAPLILHSINPLYAANAIEQSRSSFKNSLLNLLLFREDRAAVPDAVYRSVERQAATVLAEAPIETAVDRSGLIRWGYVLAALVAALGLYKAFSPKDPLVTVERIIAPWADVAPPTRVTIRDVQPGNGTYVAGRRVDVSAELDGLDDEEPVWLYFSTADGQIVDQALRMNAASGRSHRVAVPPEGVDLRQDITYRIEAGDAKTPTYELAVENAPTIVVKSIDYDYPTYTEGVLQDRRDERSGDIKALEGTRVTIHAEANMDIASAHIDFACDGIKDLPMTVKGRQASRAFELNFVERANRVAEHTRYQILFTTRQQRQNDQPVQHTIEVVPDLPPEVEVVRPDKDEVLVPENGQEAISIKALDPDFKLDDVRLAMTVEGGKTLPPQSLLAEKDRPWQGWLAANYKFVPRQHGLKAGSVVTFHAAARDNRAPEANVSKTREYRIRVIAPQPTQKNHEQKPTPADPNEKRPEENQRPNEKPDPQDSKPGDSPGEKKPSDKKEDKSKQGEKGQQGDQQDQTGGAGEQGDSKEQNQQKKNPGGGKSDANKDPSDGDNQDGQPQPSAKGNAGNAKDQREGEQPNGGAAGNRKKQDGGENKGNDTGEPQGDGTAGGQKSAQRGNPAGERKADDSDAIDELLKDRQKTAGDKEPSDKSKPDGEGDSTENKTTEPGENTDQQSVRKPKPETGDAERSPSPTDDAAPKDQGAEKSPDGDSTKTDRASDAEGLGKKSEKGQPGKTDSGGAKPKADLESNEKSQQKSGEQPTEQQPGLGDPGRSNAGQAAGKDPDGAPEAQEKNKPRRQNPREGEQGGKGKEDEAKSPSQSENQTNNSKGKNQGDRSGGGKQGGGEGSKQAGQDKPGSQQSSDKGANASEEKGDGETGSKAGEGEKADGNTGQSGNDKGPGTKKTKSGEKTGGDGQPKNGEKQPADADKTDKSKSNGNETSGKSGQTKSDQNQDGQERGGDAPGAGNAPRTDDQSTPRENDPPEAPREDEPNLDHSRRATDLALDHLRDRMQKGQEQEILKKLGWSRDEADEFLRRWADLKRKANQAGADGADGRRQLDDALKSLGLRPGRTTTRTTTVEKDAAHGLTSGPRVPAPPEYADRAKAYKRGIGESDAKGQRSENGGQGSGVRGQ